jgi:hypothetical protein
MRMGKVLLGAGASALVLLVVGGVVLASRGGSPRRIVQPSEVTRAFAARGITVQDPGNLMPDPDLRIGRPLANLSNAGTRGQSGYLVMTVARSLRDADRIDALRIPKSVAPDECGRRSVSEDITTLRVDNVAAQFDACDISSRPYRLAPPATLKDVKAALRSLGRVTTH